MHGQFRSILTIKTRVLYMVFVRRNNAYPLLDTFEILYIGLKSKERA